jgi:hypothetical protein
MATENPITDAIDRIERHFDKRFDGLEHRIDLIDERIEKRFASFEQRIEVLGTRHHTDFLWLITVLLGGAVGLLGVMAHGFKWI